MKNHYLHLLLPLIMQTQDALLGKTYGGIHTDYFFDAQPTADYGFILTEFQIRQMIFRKINLCKDDADFWDIKLKDKSNIQSDDIKVIRREKN
jgi:hypothetical protein